MGNVIHDGGNDMRPMPMPPDTAVDRIQATRVRPVAPTIASAPEEIFCTRTARTWTNGGNKSYANVVMSLPRDVLELTGIRAGDTLLVTGCADGTIKAMKADSDGGSNELSLLAQRRAAKVIAAARTQEKGLTPHARRKAIQRVDDMKGLK